MSSGLADTGSNFGLVAAMPRDIAMLKMENESFHAMAVARPRDFASIAAEMKKQFELFPSFAKEAIYAKPVGKDSNNKERVARNLSVRAAEAIAEAYGYCRVRTNVELIDGHPDVVRVEAYFTDYQKGKVWEDAAIVSKWYKDRNGKMQKIADDRFFGVTVRAAQSKLVREVILRSVAPGLRLELFDMAERQLAKLLDDTEVDKIVSAFSNYNVTQEMIEVYLGRAKAVGWTEKDRLDLLGVFNAIKDGEVTVEGAFSPDVSDEPDQKPAAPSAVNEFVNGKKENSASAKPKVASEMAAKPQQPEPVKPKTSQTVTDPNPTTHVGGKPAATVIDKPFGAFRAQIVAADSQGKLLDIGKAIQASADITAGEKTSLTRFAQKRMAEVVGVEKPKVSDVVKGYLDQIEKVDDPDAAQSVSIDILSDDTLTEADRELLFAELRKKTD